MHINLAAARVLQGVVDEGRSLDRALEDLGDDFNGNPAELREIVYGGCRFYFCLDNVLSRLLVKPVKARDRIVHFLLIGALYQIQFMRTPDHAVVNESVDALTKTKFTWARNLINGVLRNYLRKQDELIQAMDNENSGNPHLAVAFPRHLFDRIQQDWPQNCQAIFEASNQKPPLTLRVNQLATTRDAYALDLQRTGIDFALTGASEVGVTLRNPVPVSKIPGFDEGLVSVQDESAQLVTAAMELSAGQTVLDGCAAPGGKTCLMLESLPDLAAVVAVDLPDRTAAINQNLTRLNLNANVIAADLLDTSGWWDGSPFDRILLDAPCSGSGVIRRHPDIKHRRRASDIDKFSSHQQSMLEAVWPLLKPGGKLLYVTCSIFSTENDDVIEKFTQERDDFELQSLTDIFGLKTRYGRQRLPGVHSGDGFYYCCVTKLPG
jgi:16S rRNA (cytosine967-C5)-methyltransferase